MPPKQKHKNRLTLIRTKKALGQKQVALLLGHRTADQISRYERGAKLPSLKTALKLAIIYNLPVRVLLYDYYNLCVDELRKREKVLKATESGFSLANHETDEATEFCTYKEKLTLPVVKEQDLDKARHHIAELIEARSNKM